MVEFWRNTGVMLGGSWRDDGGMLGGYWEDAGEIQGGECGGVLEGCWRDDPIPVRMFPSGCPCAHVEWMQRSPPLHWVAMEVPGCPWVPLTPQLTGLFPQYGMQLYRNYQQAQARLSPPPWIGPTPLVSVPCPPQPLARGDPPVTPLSPTAQRLRQCPGGHGLLRVHGPGD